MALAPWILAGCNPILGVDRDYTVGDTTSATGGTSPTGGGGGAGGGGVAGSGGQGSCVPEIELCNERDDDCDDVVDNDCLSIVSPSEPFTTTPVSAPGSSVYFVVDDPSYGPVAPDRIWWGTDGNATEIHIPIVSRDGSESALLVAQAFHAMDGIAEDPVECEAPVPVVFELNAARCKGYDHSAEIHVEAGGNDSLTPGVVYVTDPARPMAIESRRWHIPNEDQLVDSLVPRFAYAHP